MLNNRFYRSDQKPVNSFIQLKLAVKHTVNVVKALTRESPVLRISPDLWSGRGRVGSAATWDRRSVTPVRGSSPGVRASLSNTPSAGLDGKRASISAQRLSRAHGSPVTRKA